MRAAYGDALKVLSRASAAANEAEEIRQSGLKSASDM